MYDLCSCVCNGHIMCNSWENKLLLLIYGLQLNILQNHKPSIYQYMQEMCCRSLDLKFKAKLKLESGNQKFQYGHQAAILIVTYLKINRLLSIHTSNVLLKFGLDIQSQTEVKVQKPKNPRWPPGSHFESDIAENQYASAHGHQQHAYEIPKQTWVTLQKPCRLQTDRQTDKLIPVYPPTNFVGRGYKKKFSNDSITDTP